MFLPVITLSSIAGDVRSAGVCLRPGNSRFLLAALTVTPALCMVLLQEAREGNDTVVRDRDPPVVNWTRGHYRHLLRGIVAHPKSTIHSPRHSGWQRCLAPFRRLRSCPTSRRAISPSTCRRWRALPSPSRGDSEGS